MLAIPLILIYLLNRKRYKGVFGGKINRYDESSRLRMRNGAIIIFSFIGLVFLPWLQVKLFKFLGLV